MQKGWIVATMVGCAACSTSPRREMEPWRQQLAHAEIAGLVPGHTVQLNNGMVVDSATGETVHFGGALTFDSIEGAATSIVVTDDRLASISYVALFQLQNGELVNVATKSFGQKTTIKSLAWTGGLLVVERDGFAKGDATCCPSLLIHDRFALGRMLTLQKADTTKSKIFLNTHRRPNR